MGYGQSMGYQMPKIIIKIPYLDWEKRTLRFRTISIKFKLSYLEIKREKTIPKSRLGEIKKEEQQNSNKIKQVEILTAINL